MPKEAIVAYFNVYIKHIAGMTKKNTESSVKTARVQIEFRIPVFLNSEMLTTQMRRSVSSLQDFKQSSLLTLSLTSESFNFLDVTNAELQS